MGVIRYDFGMRFMGSEIQAGSNNYLYNLPAQPTARGWQAGGKEQQTDFGIHWYDYGARFYDPQLGRWHVVDPLAEKYYPLTPFNYVDNSPLLFIDPDGLEKYKFKVSGKVTTGKLGLQGKIENVGFGGNISLGGGELKLSIYLSFDTETYTPGLGVTITNSLVEKGSYSATIGVFSGEMESKKDLISLDLNTTDGFTQKSDNKFIKTESGGLYFFSTEDTEGEDTQVKFKGGAEASAAIVGVGLDFEIGSENTDIKSNNNQENNTNSQTNNDTNRDNTIIRKKEKEL